MIGIVHDLGLERKRSGILRSIGASGEAHCQRIRRRLSKVTISMLWVLALQLLIARKCCGQKSMFNVNNLVVLPLNGALIFDSDSAFLANLQVLFLRVGTGLSPIQFRH